MGWFDRARSLVLPRFAMTAELHYRLSIAPELELFRPEIEYVCDFLDDCYLLRRAAEAPRVLHYGAAAPRDAFAVPARLFPAYVRVDRHGMHPRRQELAAFAKENRPPRNNRDWNGAIGYDAVGLIFLLLSRLEERDHPARDRYERFSIEAAVFPPEQGRLFPFADRAAEDIARALTGETRPRRRTSYDVLFTHDVDTLRGYHRPFEPLRHALGDIVKRANPKAAITRLQKAYRAGEPWSSFRRLMDLSERHGLTSHFYFMGPSDDPMDSPYAVTMQPLLRAVVCEVRERGHVAGFHPGFRTATDAHEWSRQREGLEAVVGAPVREGRQHVLRYDAAVTPRIWSDAGMALDCTLAYPEATGFRSGTCRAHRAYDLVARCGLPLRQLSTAVVEFGLFGGKYRDLSVDRALSDALWAATTCRQFGGTFSVLFHTGQTDRHLWAWLDRMIAEAA